MEGISPGELSWDELGDGIGVCFLGGGGDGGGLLLDDGLDLLMFIVEARVSGTECDCGPGVD